MIASVVRDCLDYREVLRNILARDLKIKYRRTFFGYFWSLLNPVMQLGVLALVFSHIVNRGIHDYALYLFSGLLVWNFFSSALQLSSKAMLENESFIKKIYLPKVIFPLSKVLMRAIDFLFSLVALSILGFAFGFPLHGTLVLIPFAFIPLFAFTMGLSLFVSVSTVFFRDVEYLLGVFLQLLYFATPIMYWEGMLPEKYRVYLGLNPLLSQIHLFNRIVYEGIVPTMTEWALAYGVGFGVLLFGLAFLRINEDEIVFRM